MAKSMRPEGDQEAPPNTIAIILLIGGFACFIAWPLINLLSIMQESAMQRQLLAPPPAILLALLGAFVTLLAACKRPFATWLEARRKALVLRICLAVVILLLPLFGYLALRGVGVLAVPVMVLWFLNGVAFALLLLFWGAAWNSFTTCYGKKDLGVTLLVAILIAATICIGIAFMQFELFVVALAVIPLISLVMLAVSTDMTERLIDTLIGIAPATPPVKKNMPGRHAVFVVTIGAYCSFIVFSCAGTIGVVQTLVAACAAILASCGVLFAIAAIKGELPRFLLVERLAYPVAISGALASYFIQNAVVAIVMVFLSVLGTSAFMTAHWDLMIKWSQRFKLPTISHFSYGTFTLSGGFLLGALLYWAIIVLAAPASIASTVICLAFMLCVITSTAFTPFDSESVFNDFESSRPGWHEPDGRREPDGRHEPEGEFEGIWRSVIDEMAAEYGLTPREVDVLAYQSRGRSIKHISEQLCISEHTTKTHVYHIYKKLAINNLQELIDLVDGELKKAEEKCA